MEYLQATPSFSFHLDTQVAPLPAEGMLFIYFRVFSHEFVLVSFDGIPVILLLNIEKSILIFVDKDFIVPI